MQLTKWVNEIKGQVHKFIHWPWSKVPQIQHFHFFFFFFLNCLTDWSQILCGASMGWGNESLIKWSISHDKVSRHAQLPIYGKNLKKSSSLEPKGGWPWKLVCSIGYSSSSKLDQMMPLGWPWPVLGQGQVWSLVLLYGKKVKQWIFFRNCCSLLYRSW